MASSSGGQKKKYRTEIWAVGGGKGGTGKSFLAANLGIFLAGQGYRVILIDADLGCANLHTWLGVTYPDLTLSDLMKGRVRALKDAVTETGIPNLSLISGAQDILDMANPKYNQKMRMIRHIQELDVDYIILDLGAGTSFNVLDFFIMADRGLIAILPEPTSIENAYRFIKTAFYRKFKKLAKDPNIRGLIAMALDQKNELGIKTPHDLIDQVVKIDEAVGSILKKEILRFNPKLIINQIRSRDDIALGFSMRSACSRYFGITIEYPGYIEFDDAVRQAGQKRKPLLRDYPSSNAALGLSSVAENLVKNTQLNPQGFLNDFNNQDQMVFYKTQEQ